MREEKRSLIIQFILIVEVLLALIISTFSWFDNVHNPSIRPFELSVTSSNGLYIVLEGEKLLASSKINIKDLLGENEIPTLVQSSSKDGVKFTTLDTSTIDSSATDYWDSASFIDAIPNVHYLEFRFFLLTEDTQKDIFLSEDLSQFAFSHVTTMTDNITGANQIGPTSAMRIAFSFNNEAPVILGETAENDENGYQTLVVLNGGTYINPNHEREGIVEYGQVVHTLDEYYLGHVEYDTDGVTPLGYYTDTTKAKEATPIYTIGANVLVPVTVRIWMEGGDPDCVNSASIIDTMIEIAINLCAKDHL